MFNTLSSIGVAVFTLLSSLFGVTSEHVPSIESSSHTKQLSLVSEVHAQSTTTTTTKSGNWNDPTVWSTNQVPSSNNKAVISSGHTVTYNLANSTVSRVEVQAGATLQFDPSMTTTLQTDANVIVEGRLVMKSSNPQNIQTLRFINIDEEAFVGGGMDPIATDVGLWVMGSGILDIEGANKTAWTRLTDGIPQGATTITVQDATNWRVGDEISIAPTEPPTVGSRSHTGFHLTTIAAISGNTITLSSPTTHPHPMVNDTWTAEVMNLTRNVRIEGTGNGDNTSANNGRAHIFIRSTQPQSIKYLGIRHMGPRQHTGTSNIHRSVLGRYSLHFHHSMDGSRGSMVEGVVSRNNGAHAFVPHVSHGVTMQDSIAYEGWEDAFWWDPGSENASHDIVWVRNIVAILQSDPSNRGFTLSAYHLMQGEQPILRDSVAVGVQGNSGSSGFQWGGHGSSFWIFDRGNISHNNKIAGIRTWQNSSTHHTIDNFVAYHNGNTGIQHGAYVNGFQYRDSVLYGNKNSGISLNALSHQSKEIRFENIVIDGSGISEVGISQGTGALSSRGRPMTFRNITIKNTKSHAVHIRGTKHTIISHFINSTLSGNEFYIENDVLADTIVRVQPASGQPFALHRSDQQGELVSAWNARRTSIQPFAPVSIGTGDGLKGEYFEGTDFTDLRAVKVDPEIWTSGWSNGGQPHPSVTVPDYSVRWTGQIEPLYSETHTMYLRVGGGPGTLWIDDQLLISDGGYPNEYSAEIDLEAGRRYDIRIEFREESGNRARIGLSWDSPSLFMKERVPQRQLYSLMSSEPSPTPTSAPPTPTPSQEVLACHDALIPLTPEQETGSVTSQGKGAASVRVNPNTHSLSYHVIYENLTSSETMAHIHGFSSHGADSGILHTLPMGTPKIDTWNYAQNQEQNILNGLSYINIHTNQYAGGEIRGQIDQFQETSCDTQMPTPSLSPSLKPGDVNNDGVVNLTDLSILLSNFGMTGATRAHGDLNGDGTVNLADLSILLANFGA